MKNTNTSKKANIMLKTLVEIVIISIVIVMLFKFGSGLISSIMGGGDDVSDRSALSNFNIIKSKFEGAVNKFNEDNTTSFQKIKFNMVGMPKDYLIIIAKNNVELIEDGDNLLSGANTIGKLKTDFNNPNSIYLMLIKRDKDCIGLCDTLSKNKIIQNIPLHFYNDVSLGNLKAISYMKNLKQTENKDKILNTFTKDYLKDSTTYPYFYSYFHNTNKKIKGYTILESNNYVIIDPKYSSSYDIIITLKRSGYSFDDTNSKSQKIPVTFNNKDYDDELRYKELFLFLYTQDFFNKDSNSFDDDLNNFYGFYTDSNPKDIFYNLEDLNNLNDKITQLNKKYHDNLDITIKYDILDKINSNSMTLLDSQFMPCPKISDSFTIEECSSPLYFVGQSLSYDGNVETVCLLNNDRCVAVKIHSCNEINKKGYCRNIDYDAILEDAKKQLENSHYFGDITHYYNLPWTFSKSFIYPSLDLENWGKSGLINKLHYPLGYIEKFPIYIK